MTSQTVRADLAFIRAHLAFLAPYITRLEEQGMQLTTAVDLMEEVQGKLANIPGEVGQVLKTKLDKVLEKNPGFGHIKAIAGVLSGTASTIPEGMGPADVAMYKFCPTASVDVERSFSLYKNILSDKRHNLTNESLKKIMLCHCNYNRD